MSDTEDHTSREVTMRVLTRFEYEDGEVEYRHEMPTSVSTFERSGQSKRIIGYAEVEKHSRLPKQKSDFERFKRLVEGQSLYVHWKEGGYAK